MLLLGMIFGFLSPLMYALAVDWYMVIPAVLFLSVSMAATWTVRNIFLADSLRDADRATGFSVLSTIGAMPGIFMPFISAFLVEVFGGINQEGIRPLFYIQFLLLVPISLWIYKRLKEPTRDKLKKPLNFLESLKKFIILDRGPRIWLLVGIFDSFGMIAFPFLMVFAVEVKGATTSIIALMGVANTLATMLLTIPFGRLADRIGRKPVMILGLVPMFAWVVTLVYGPSSSWLILASVFEGAFTATFPTWQTYTMELIPKPLRGSYGGIQGIVRGLASMTASTLGGILWETIGPGSVFLAAFTIEIVAMVLIIALPETLIKNKKVIPDKKD
jgi:MFS family permease